MVTVILNPLPGVLCVWHGSRCILIMRGGGVDSNKVGITCLESTPKGKKLLRLNEYCIHDFQRHNLDVRIPMRDDMGGLGI